MVFCSIFEYYPHKDQKGVSSKGLEGLLLTLEQAEYMLLRIVKGVIYMLWVFRSIPNTELYTQRGRFFLSFYLNEITV